MRSRRHAALALPFLFLPVQAAAQTTPAEGLRDATPAVHALVNARVHVAPGRVLERGTIVVRDGVIEAVGANARVPADARVWELNGLNVYAGFIDAHSDLGMPTDAPDEERGPVGWNAQLRAFTDAAAEFRNDTAKAAQLRSQGVTLALAVPRHGLIRGRSALVSLGEGAPRDLVLRSGVAQSVALSRARGQGGLGGGYPTSQMGSIAFIRQSLLDADWYVRAHAAYERNPTGLRRPETNAALAALSGALGNDRRPLLVETSNEEELLRAVRIAAEFPVTLWVRGSGSEYRLIEPIAAARVPLILPVAFPDVPDVDRPENALNFSLADLRHWHLAAENPARLHAAGVAFALTADGLRDRRHFLRNVRTAVLRGLPAQTALAALTTTPARMLGVERTHGTVEAGKVASLVVVDGDVFGDGAQVRDVWVDGRRFEISAPAGVDPRGQWQVIATSGQNIEGRLTLDGTLERLTGSFAGGAGEARIGTARLSGESRRLVLAFPGSALGVDGVVRLSGTVAAAEMHGWGELPDGARVSWRAVRTGPVTQATAASGAGPSGTNGPGDPASAPPGTSGSSARTVAAPATLALAHRRPSMEYGRAAIPDQPEHVLVRNATIWTQGPQGRIEGGDLLVRRGRVVEVGRNVAAPRGAIVIDAAGRHVTPGLIDAHVHSGGAGGINEGGGAIVPEVRLGDVLTIDNIWMYRQLAGGLTAAHVMHGSANPIGGQNQHVKMRWGALPEELKLEGAPRTVKFALGENPVRRADRYPDTRMGTEQIIRDHFQQARDYQRAWQEWERGNKRGIPPRRDLRLDALVDILDGRILVQSHSYRQDEILMLMRLAEEFGFRIKAFHHGVEAYKVAPELARHGAGAVVWSDWSSFKIEAYDATTFNARVLLDAGVVTSLHSDNSQLATRMNWEAAKLLRTGIGEEQALSLVTNSTARLLGVDDRIGSLEPGKDADFVIWSGHPLSTYTRAHQTWVDGRKYFDVEEDRLLRQDVVRERGTLIQLALEARERERRQSQARTP